ncbi:MAG: hypothetical protein EXR12_00120 [Rhodospirillaceae bacterium]|nr:hypothetical protein [Rhodospirillaceae bacterium]
METITALVACGAAFALSYYFGYGRAPTTFIAAVLGAISGIGFAIVFFALTLAVTILLPDTFDARTLGIHFARLLVLAPIGAAVIAAFSHRFSRTKIQF